MSRHIAVIGSGAIGSVSAIELLRAGHRVTVIEPEAAGGEQAASYGNAGWLSSHSVIPPAEPGVWKKVPGYILDPLGPLAIRWPHLPKSAPWLVRYLLSGWTEARVEATAQALRPLLKDAPALHKALAAEAGVPHLVAEGGVLHVYRDRSVFDADSLAWNIRARTGIAWRELSGEALRAEDPALPDRYGFAVAVDEAGRCRNPGAYVAALAALAKSRGAVVEPARAIDFRFDNERLTGVVTDRGIVDCDGAVIAAGVHSAPLTRRLGDALPLESERGYHVMLEGVQTGMKTAFMASDAKMVVQQMEHGLRAAGQVEIASVEASPDWRRAEILRGHLAKMFPGVDVSQAKLWLGHRPSTPDGRPCIGLSRRSRDVVYAFGHGHVGLVSSARTGRVVAQLVGGQAAEIPIAGLDPRRFL
ncbi:FAD-dependent oxidoreductase [Rhizobiaceae bacterium BDR2-2]|uniref:FAD-dependent oxidoreductase n=1 Tax=Ectorhizobium quercum TaxID=2965071 RepID=A0AAE3N1R8_9HYPH|nr:FAD-dependent oxidoreductase [Ectorhizobium quercum]MCX8998356.1 FAD-dependent oxidoreductase [Ectorhizobium quercum]